MRVALIIMLSFYTMAASSQNFIYIGTKSYPSTNNWSFLKSGKYAGYEYNSSLIVSFAKSSTSGYLVLSTETSMSNQSIGGTIMIYMKDGSVISLTNRINKDHADGYSTVIYTVTSSQISNLKSNDIAKIRYSVISSYGKDNFTAVNRHNVSVQPGVYDERTYNTAQEIKELIENN